MTVKYSLTNGSDIYRTRDGAYIPNDPFNVDRAEYDAWVAAGGIPDVTAVDLIAYAAQKRWEKEVGGIVVSGIHIATDDRSKQMLLGARVAANADPEFETQWVGADGTIASLTGLQVIGISNAVLAHVSAYFAIFAEVKAGIDAGTINKVSDVDAAFA